MNGVHPPGPDGQAALLALEQAFVPVARPNPVVVLWRWRYETALLLGVPLLLAAVARAAGPVATTTAVVAAVVTTAVAAAVSPTLRRLARARVWCVVTPHRVRTGCAQARVHSRQGRLPVVLYTRSVPAGQEVLLWCRAGTSAEHLDAARPVLRAACWAVDVRVVPSPRHTHLVTVQVIRDPAAAPGPSAPAAHRRPHTGPAPTAVVPRPRQPAE